MQRHHLSSLVCLLLVLGITITACASAVVVRRDEKTYIVDRLGEHWDVTQAVELGFQAERFQYGIGRDAFTTLGDEDLTPAPTDPASRRRVIGVAEGGESHAYSVRTLTRHEIANTTIASEPIVVGY